MHSSISSQPKDKYFSKSQGKISRGTHIEAIEDISRSLSLFGASESVLAQNRRATAPLIADKLSGMVNDSTVFLWPMKSCNQRIDFKC